MPSSSPALLTSPARTRQPGLRLVPTPHWEPPYEDSHAPRLPSAAHASLEPAAGVDAVQGTLALTFLLPSGLPALPSTPLLRLVEPARRGSNDDEAAMTTIDLAIAREFRQSQSQSGAGAALERGARGGPELTG